MKKRKSKKKVRKLNFGILKIAIVVTALVLITLPVAAINIINRQDDAKTDRTFQEFKGSKYTSKYHIYAGGLDWSKPVGMLIYADGSGEYGLKNPNSTYLLAGKDGLINVAKRNNMVLLTPFSPNKACSDGDGSCWYLGDSVGYAKWAEELVTYVQGNYPIKQDRIAFGGYSSGAQLATEFWVPSGAAQRTMTDGVIVAISYGGSPKMRETSYSSDFKNNVHINWNTGSLDSAYTGSTPYGVKAGYNHYTNNNFSTSLDVIDDLGHSRSDFGKVMDAQINRHVPSVGSVPTPTPQPEPTPTAPPTDPESQDPVPQPDPSPAPEPEKVDAVKPFETNVEPGVNSAKFGINVPNGTRPATYVYVYWSKGRYEYEYTYKDGRNVELTLSNLPANSDLTYKVYSGNDQKASGSFKTSGDTAKQPESSDFETTVTPQSRGATFYVDIPDETRRPTYVYVYWGKGNYEYEYTYKTGVDVPFRLRNLPKRADLTYKVFSGGKLKASGSFRTK